MITNKNEQKHRMALTLFVTAYIFIILFIAAGISLAGVSILLKFDKIPVTADGFPNPQYALVYMFITSLLVGIVIISISSRLYLKNINVFINKMNSLAAGDFTARLDYGEFINKHPTVSEITKSFNKMAEELENTKVLRTDFVNNFSHEFKTPIVSIAGFTKLLRRGNLSEKQKEEYLQIIEEESLRLSAMATNVLNMTKVENQVILSEVSEFNLSEQIRNSVLLLENFWTQKNIEINLDIDEHIIEGDEEILKQVWLNLFHNAVKFTSEYGFVTIKILDKNENYEISFANPGEEIPVDTRDRIFDKFYQVDESHSSEGNGIGLAIVKRVVELHSGTVSVNCNKGINTFTVSLPKNQK